MEPHERTEHADQPGQSHGQHQSHDHQAQPQGAHTHDTHAHDTHAHDTHGAHAHAGVHLDEEHWRKWADSTELEGEVLIGFVVSAAKWVNEIRGTGAGPVRRVLDVGSGPGVGACELARLFPDAAVVAADSSPAMLERAAARIDRLRLHERVSTKVAELPGGLDDVEAVDFIWASMSLHHMGDEVAALRTLRERLNPDGLIAIAEFGDPMRTLPDDLGFGTYGLSERMTTASAAWFSRMRDGLPDAVPSADLPTMLANAGFDVVGTRTERVQLPAPLDERSRRFVINTVARAQGMFREYLSDDDLTTIGILCDPHDPRSVALRTDVFIDASRTLIVARPRPSGT